MKTTHMQIDQVKARQTAAQQTLRMKWPFLGSALLLTAVLLRSWSTLSQNAFFVEDALLFSHYYGAVQPFKDLTDNRLGQPYITLISNFFAWIYAFADVRLQALLYQWTGLLFALTAAVILFFSGLIRSRIILLLGPLLMGLTALNHVYYYNTLIYVMYTAVILLLALLFFPDPSSRRMNTLLLFLMLVLPWAGPYSVLAIPATLALMMIRRLSTGRRFMLAAALVSTALYFLSVEGNTTRLSHLKKWGIVKHYFEVLLEQVIFMGQLNNVPGWLWAPVLLVIVFCLFIFRADRSYIINSLIFFGIISASLALFYLSSKFTLYLFTSACHRVVSLYFWCFFLLYTIDRFFTRFGESKATNLCFAVSLVLLIILDNQRYPRKHQVELIPATNTFLETVHRLEQLNLGQKNHYIVLELDNYQRPSFVPQAIIGSRSDSAEQLMADDLPPDYRNPFISEEKL